MRFLPFALLVVLLAVAPVTAARFASAPSDDDHDVCAGQLIDIVGLAYWVLVGDTPDQAWGYIESNGVAGLQRGGWGGHFPFGPGDPCWTDDPAGPDFNFY